MAEHLILGVTGASGIYAAELLIDKAPWPVDLIVSRWGQDVYAHERGTFEQLSLKADTVYGNDDLRAPISSGSSPTVGMVILPCSMNTLGHIASGLGDNLIARAAHCHLKERRPLVMCLRETPLTAIDLDNASKVAYSGGVIMPLSPPFYMFGEKDPDRISMKDLLAAYVDRVLAVLGHPAEENWENIQ